MKGVRVRDVQMWNRGRIKKADAIPKLKKSEVARKVLNGRNELPWRKKWMATLAQ